MKYQAMFEPGDDDSIPTWVVVEWTRVDADNRVGQVVATFGISEKILAQQEAATLNAAADLELVNSQECEYDL